MEEEKKEEVTEEVKEETIEKVEEKKEETPKKKKKTGLIIAIICAIIIPIALIITVALILVGSYTSKKTTTTKTKVEKEVPESAYRLSGNGLEDFDLYFLQLENKQENVIYSPLSIKYALAMLNEGTDGASHEQIFNVIGDYKAKKYNNNAHMSFANAMFIRDTFSRNVKEDYTNNLKQKYGAEVILDDFKSASKANDWVSNRTFNLINNLLDDATVQRENFILINALAIDMNWVNRIQAATAPLPEGMGQKSYHVKYDHEKYKDEQYYEWISPIEDDNYPKMTFNNSENKKSVLLGASFNRYDIIKELGEDNIRKTVGDAYQAYIDKEGSEICGTKKEYVDQYMKTLGENYKREDISTDFYLYVDDDVKAFAKDLQKYDGTTLQYVAIMPLNETLTDYVKDLNAEKTNKIIKSLKEAKINNFKDGVVTKITGQIPLFKYEYKLELMKDLQELGITDIFDINDADMSKMLNEEKQYIGDATHKAMIEFSNDGIKAAAATAMGGMGATGCPFDYLYEIPVEEIDITMDKPFVYIIRDKDTGEVWFTGTVYNPE